MGPAPTQRRVRDKGVDRVRDHATSFAAQPFGNRGGQEGGGRTGENRFRRSETVESGEGARLLSIVSGPHSWTQTTPSSASAKFTHGVSLAITSSTERPPRRSAACKSLATLRTKPIAAAVASGSGSQSRTSQPALAKQIAHERPIRPVPTTATDSMFITQSPSCIRRGEN